ncbi:MAG: 3-isopropylmalate dehydratase large subunit [Elusimicrobiota bacterium]
MGQTITQKILAAHFGVKQANPGEFIEAKVDLALGNDITAPLAVQEFRKVGAQKVFDRKRVVLVMDHFTPNKDIKSAEQCKFLRDFAREQKLLHFYDTGRCGIEHALLPEQGLVAPGELVIGADSHTCTYGAIGAVSTGVGSTDLAAVMATGKIWLRVPEAIKVVFSGKLNKWVTGKDLILYLIGKIGVDGANYCTLEFHGDTVKQLSMASRLTICNMVIEAGAKNGIFYVDNTTTAFLKDKVLRKYKVYTSDPDAKYKTVVDIDVTKVFPQVSFPHLPENAKDVRSIKKVYVDQVVIGSCTNGLIEDLRIAAKILTGKKVNPNVRVIIFPATPAVWMQAMKEGLLKTFMTAGATVSTPTCGPCLGGHMGILAGGERCAATTNRNFVGRMGSTKSEVYLVNPAVAAATAVKGYIVHPDKVL